MRSVYEIVYSLRVPDAAPRARSAAHAIAQDLASAGKRALSNPPSWAPATHTRRGHAGAPAAVGGYRAARGPASEATWVDGGFSGSRFADEGRTRTAAERAARAAQDLARELADLPPSPGRWSPRKSTG